MAKLGTIEIAGRSGNTYSFDVYPYDSNWNEVGAVYAVSRRTPNPDGTGNHAFIYIGQTDNLKERHSNHHKADCFKGHSRNCLCIKMESSEKNRLAIEADLLAGRHWPCNG